MRRVTVFDYERVVHYRRGRLLGLVSPGRHWLFGNGNHVVRVDLRPRVLTMPLQEVLTSDGVSVKVSLAASWRVEDPIAFVQASESALAALYLQLQLALRAPIASAAAGELVSGRAAIGDEVLHAARENVSTYGIVLEQVAIRDLAFPGELRTLFAEVVRARQESLAALERARGEGAALRSLANTAQLLEAHPALLHLRALQAAESSPGTKLVLTLAAQSPADAQTA